ncbi:hypothetical protein PWT90_00927 [Aphanocladium album]|nr:hypothetical protein PWT90_00927 [Aphanocladium album]
MATRTTTRSRAAKAAAEATAPASATAASQVKIEPKKLSLFGYLDMIPGLVAIVATAVASFVTGLFRSEKDSKTYYLHVANTVLRKATHRLSPLQLQLVSPNTDIVYNRYARARKLEPDTVALAHGGQGHWVGNKNATNVLIWFHGGGFCLPANIGYFKFFERVLKDVNATGGDLCIFAITYTLAPHGTYPVQLTQSVEGLRHVLEKTGRSPRNVLLGGDSAGGNLTVGVLSHLAHPHPSIVPLPLSEPLCGAATIAPWVSLHPDLSDQVIYDGGDIVTTFVGEAWSKTFMGGAKPDYYTDAVDAPSSWFETFPVGKMLILGGENEILMPLIEMFYEKLKGGFPNVELFMGKRESHVAPVYNIYAKAIETVAYVEHCPFDFNNFIYKVELESPATPASFSGNQPGTVPPPEAGVNTLIVRLSNLRAEGLNNANRVASDVACSFIARQAMVKAGLDQIVPATYAWTPAKSIDVIEEENFGWVVNEYKPGQDLDAQLPMLAKEERESVLDTIAQIVSALQNAPVPATVQQFGGLSFDAQGAIVSGEMALMKGGPFDLYTTVWAAKLEAQLAEAEASSALNGWRDEGVAQRLRSFINSGGLSDSLNGVASHQRTFVHGDLTTNNMLYDDSSKKITALLDFDWSVITHPAEEFFSGFRDIGGCVNDEPRGILTAILANDFSSRPDNLTEKENQQWDAASDWSAAAGRNGVKLPSDIVGVEQIKALHGFSSAICPFELSSEVMLKRLSEEGKTTKKKEALETITQFLAEHNF